MVRTFTVRNDGASTLTLGVPIVPLGFSLVAGDPLVGSLAPGAFDTFQVQMDTSSGGTRSGDISVANNDSSENPFNFTIAGTVNYAPVVNAPNVTAQQDQWLLASSLFSVSDADGDPMTQYEFIDNTATAGSGYIWVGGATPAAGSTITVTAANLASVWVRGGVNNGVDGLQVRANDGFGWSNWANFNVTTRLPNRAPVVTAPGNGVAVNTAVAASTLFSVTDADGDTPTIYRFWDPAGGGRFTVNGVTQASNANIDVLAANLGTVNYVGGATPGSETEWVQVFDGFEWSAWQSWSMQSVSDAAGNTNGTARAVPLPLNPTAQSFTDWVGNGDSADVYQFSLGSPGALNLNLTGASTPVNIAIRDAGNNAVFSTTTAGATPASLNVGPLATGTYFASITPTLPNSTFYTLALSSV